MRHPSSLSRLLDSTFFVLFQRETTIPIASITSLGTGRMPLREVQQLDVFRPQNVSEAYQVALGVTELSRMLVEMATQSEGMELYCKVGGSVAYAGCGLEAQGENW